MSEATELLEKLGKYATEKEVPPGHEYAPPKGVPNLKLPPSAKIYKIDPPSKQRDLLVAYERRFTIPIAMMIAPCFGTNPVPDDVYRLAPEMAKNNLFIIFSRSGITRTGTVLNWDAVVVVVQKLCIVRVNCSLDPGNDKFTIDKVMFWSRQNQDYHVVTDPAGSPINANILPYMMDRYVQVENIH